MPLRFVRLIWTDSLDHSDFFYSYFQNEVCADAVNDFSTSNQASVTSDRVTSFVFTVACLKLEFRSLRSTRFDKLR